MRSMVNGPREARSNPASDREKTASLTIAFPEMDIWIIKFVMNYIPRELMVWLRHIDVNGLSDEDQDLVAIYDIDDASDLRRLVSEWMKPRFEEVNEISRASMRGVLEKSKDWSVATLAPIFAHIAFPSGQDFADIDRFMDELRRQILT